MPPQFIPHVPMAKKVRLVPGVLIANCTKSTLSVGEHYWFTLHLDTDANVFQLTFNDTTPLTIGDFIHLFGCLPFFWSSKTKQWTEISPALCNKLCGAPVELLTTNSSSFCPTSDTGCRCPGCSATVAFLLNVMVVSCHNCSTLFCVKCFTLYNVGAPFCHQMSCTDIHRHHLVQYHAPHSVDTTPNNSTHLANMVLLVFSSLAVDKCPACGHIDMCDTSSIQKSCTACGKMWCTLCCKHVCNNHFDLRRCDRWVDDAGEIIYYHPKWSRCPRTIETIGGSYNQLMFARLVVRIARLCVGLSESVVSLMCFLVNCIFGLFVDPSKLMELK